MTNCRGWVIIDGRLRDGRRTHQDPNAAAPVKQQEGTTTSNGGGHGEEKTSVVLAELNPEDRAPSKNITLSADRTQARRVMETGVFM